MRRIPGPHESVGVVLKLCIDSIQNLDLKARLENSRRVFDTAEAMYINQAEQAALHSIPETGVIGDNVTNAEMKRLYSGTFVRSVGTREIYGALKSAPENGICPLCSQRTVSQLDHYLPKSRYSSLVVTPVNLVPACGECNKVKQDLQVAQAEDQTFHPYFEDADDARWLYARVEPSDGGALVFFVDPPDEWCDTKKQRIMAHFTTYKLADLYASHSAVELKDIQYGLREMKLRNTPEEISDHLRRMAETRAAAHTNSWRTATYEALADSNWFCEGGFD